MSLSDDSYRRTILIVEDEQLILLALKMQLSAEGYIVKTATNGLKALHEVKAAHPDLILLDLLMPDKNGLETLQELRQFNPNIPVIIVSALAQEKQKVEALKLGADDYMTKPYGAEELLARIEALLRRTKATLAEPNITTEPPKILSDNYLTINLTDQEVYKDNEAVKLTVKQFEILRYLALNAGRFMAHEAILQNIWGSAKTTEKQYLYTYIKQLRDKIEPDPTNPKYLINTSGRGYYFQFNPL
jgi:two-component system, OmpR family, KDP operon response regulator KdpE